MAIDSFERKVLRQIWILAKEADSWGICYSDGLRRLYDEPRRNIPVVMLKGLHWVEQTLLMDSKRLLRKILHNTVGGKRPVGKPKRRRVEPVEKNYKKILGVINWQREAMYRQVWRGYIQEAKAWCRSLAPDENKDKNNKNKKKRRRVLWLCCNWCFFLTGVPFCLL